MQISSRFTIALHIFSCIDVFKKDYKITSDFLARSINTNPVIIRKILQQLKNAGLIIVKRGTGGAEIAKPLDEISFYDVYKAVESLEDDTLFHFHENPNILCPVGKNIHFLLDKKLQNIQKAMEDEMKNGLNAGGNQSVFILHCNCTFLPCSNRTRSRRYYYAISSLTFSSSFYLSII